MRLFSGITVFLFIFGAGLVSGPSPAWAEGFRYVTINGLDGKPFFFINIANKGSSVSYGGETETSGFTLNDKQVNAIRNGAEYWVTVLDKHKNTTFIPRISLYTDPDTSLNAFVESADSSFVTGMTQFGDMITGTGDYDEPTALIGINNYPSWGTGDMSSLPQNGNEPNLSAVMLHELGHALGIGASTNVYNVVTPSTFKFNDTLNLWTQGLRNSAGVAPAAKQKISVFLSNEGNDKTAGLYFTGTQVGEVLDGARLGYSDGINSTLTMAGIPINTWEGNIPDFSHIELQNSLMSHQSYRNWNILTQVSDLIFLRAKTN